MKKIILYTSLLLLLFSSCIEEFNADLGAADQNILVVEGNICSDSDCVFYLSHSIGINENAFLRPTIDNAKMTVTGSDGSRFDAKHVGQGEYHINIGHLSPSATYSLEIDWDGVHFVSDPASPIDAPEISKVSFAQPREDMLIDIMVTNDKPTSGKTDYYRWTYNETWEVRAKYSPVYEYDPERDKVVSMAIDKSRGWCYGKYSDIIIANTSKFDGNQIRDFRIFSIDNSDQRISQLYCCDIQQYGISQAQYEYEAARRELSSEMGGMFAPQPSELFTNIKSSDKKHRVIGFVGVCGKVSSFRLWLKRGDVVYRDIINRSIEIVDDDEFLERPMSVLYTIGYRIANEMEPLPGESWQWVVRRGVDVTAFGATLEKPSFWPN